MMRKEADMLRLFPEYLKGEELFGLTVHAVLRIAESVGARAGLGWGGREGGLRLGREGLLAVLGVLWCCLTSPLPPPLQLPGVESCQNYLFRYGRHPLMELPLMINPTGCARAEPKILTHYKR